MLKLSTVNWEDVPYEACRLAEKASGTYVVIQDIVPTLPHISARIWYNPDKEQAILSYPIDTNSDKVAAWYVGLRQIPGIESLEHGVWYQPSLNDSNILVKAALDTKTIFGPIASAFQFKENDLNKLWGGPNPLASTIAGGLLGAGTGYGAGWLTEQFLPEKHFQKGKLKRLGAALGGLAGVGPGVVWGLDNMRAHPNPAERGVGAWLSSYPIEKASRFTSIKDDVESECSEESKELNELWLKYADDAGAQFVPNIPVDQFNRVIWNDLRSYGGHTDAPLAAATTGLVQAASLSQGGANYISPTDIARIGLGMGSGYLSGMIVGKTLGALAGLRPESQQTLQQTGAWAGILANIVPIAFR